MAVYRLGSHGPEVTKIQTALKSFGCYKGPLDGAFGGGTSAAVKAFQKAKGLKVDGQVGPHTWQTLFSSEISEPAILSESLNYRCLALTGTFETGTGVPDCFCGFGGNFDGQGLSFGVLQWNLGQNTLQPLLKEMIDQHPELVKDIFDSDYDVLVNALDTDKSELLSFAQSIQHPVKYTIYEPWRGRAMTLGRTEEFQAIQVKHSKKIFDASLKLCANFNLWSERAVALMFDITVQNGSISNLVKTRIQKEIDTLDGNLSEAEREVRKMEIVANRRAEMANPRWVEDVRARKLCIARGGGVVHGIHFDLEQQFGIGLVRADTNLSSSEKIT